MLFVASGSMLMLALLSSMVFFFSIHRQRLNWCASRQPKVENQEDADAGIKGYSAVKRDIK
jgi:hypothetical protein